MSPAVAYPTYKPQTATLPLGPFAGMRDSVDPTSSRRELARLLRNVYPRDPGQSSGVVGRPGFDQMGAQLGGGGDVQFVGQFTQLDGDEFTIAIVGGRFYTLNWGTETWSEVVSAANFSTASITVSSTARIYGVPFNNTMVFTDGTNLPWTWTGASGAGGLTSLTNAPVAFGPPAVYYGKLFFIKNADRSTFVWSEENAANTGYEAGGYNNAWTLGQTDANRLTCLLGANEALYVWRENSTTKIVGEVTTNFQSTGTREAVSSTVGTKAPGSVFFDGSDIFFADAQGRPHVIRPGSEAVPIWQDFDQTIRALDSTKFHEIEGYRDPTLELAIFAYEAQGQTERSTQLCYRSTGFSLPQAVSVFDGYTFTRIGVVKNANGDQRVMHGSTDGYLYDHDTPLGNTWEDGLNAGNEAIEHEVRTNFVAYSENTESHYTRADLMMGIYSDQRVFVRSETDARIGDSTYVDFEGGSGIWGVSTWGSGTWASSGIQHGAVGLNEFGPYCGLRITHGNGSERFHFVSGSLHARPLSRYPGMP
jgi:hypothetical protein